MKEVTLKIPDSKFNFIMELFRHLELEVTEEVEIPEGQKEVVRERMKAPAPEKAIAWEEARKQFTYKDQS